MELLINSAREKERLFMFIDVHGHNSPRPSFVFGNFCQNIHQSLENRTFARLLENYSEGTFDYLGC